MSIELGRDVLFFPRVVRSTSAASGINYGILCLTRQFIFYVPKEVVELHRTGALTDSYTVNKQKISKYNGMPLEDVVPSLVRELDSCDDLDRFLTDMAAQVTGSCVVPISEINRCKIGYFAQLTLFRGTDKHKFAIGGKKNREAARAFVGEQLGLGG